MKLTPVQNKVIYCLQNGFMLITDSSVKGATISGKNIEEQFHINNRVFYNLLDKDLIYQGDWRKHRFSFVLTEKGKTIKTFKPKPK